MIEIEKKKMGFTLIFSGILFSIIIFLWPVTMILSPGAEGSTFEKIVEVATNPALYQLSFVIASLISPSILLLMLLFAVFIETNKKTPILNIMGIVFLIPYMVFVTISYTTQYTYFIGIIDSDIASDWFFGNFNSISYYFNQLGYTFFALGGILIGYRYCFEKGIKRSFGIILEICSLLSIVAFIGLALDNPLLNKATMISGLLTLPFGFIAIILGRKLKKES